MGRPALPKREQLAGVVQHVYIGRIHVVGPAEGHVAIGDRPECGQEKATGFLFRDELLGLDHAATMADPLAIEAERLDHAVAVEPVPVTTATAFVPRRPIAIEGADEIGRKHALDAERWGLELRDGETMPAKQPRVTRQGLAERCLPIVTNGPGGPGGPPRQTNRGSCRGSQDATQQRSSGQHCTTSFSSSASQRSPSQRPRCRRRSQSRRHRSPAARRSHARPG